MPYYTFYCEQCDDKHDKRVPIGTDRNTCDKCGSVTVRLPSFRSVVHGLPNGFHVNRSK